MCGGAYAHRLGVIVEQCQLGMFQPDAGDVEPAFQRQQLQLTYFALLGEFSQHVHIHDSPHWRRKNNVTWPHSTPNLVMLERLIKVSSSIRYIQSSKLTS